MPEETYPVYNVPQPVPVAPQYVEEEVEERGDDEDMSDIFDVDDEDVMGGDPDMSDILDVDPSDITGDTADDRPRRVRRVVARRPPPPQATLGGVGY